MLENGGRYEQTHEGGGSPKMDSKERAKSAAERSGIGSWGRGGTGTGRGGEGGVVIGTG